MAIRRRYANNRKLAAVFYKRAQQHRALADYFYKLASASLPGSSTAQEVSQQTVDEILGREVADAVAPGAGKAQDVSTEQVAGNEQGAGKATTKVEGPKLDYLPVIGGAVTGAGVGGASAGGLARLFLGDEEKARKWVLLSALLGAAAGGIVGAYGMSPFMTGSNLGKLAPAS